MERHPDYEKNKIGNRLLHELHLEHHNIVEISELAGMWNPHIYACLRNEYMMRIDKLEQIGAVLGYELVWRKKK